MGLQFATLAKETIMTQIVPGLRFRTLREAQDAARRLNGAIAQILREREAEEEREWWLRGEKNTA